MALKTPAGGSNSKVMDAHAVRRAMTAVALAGGVGLVGLLSAGPAYAAGLGAPGGTVTAADPVTVSGTGGSCGGSLAVSGPGYSKSITLSNNGSGTITIDPRTESNGSYTATLTTKTNGLTGCSSSTSGKSWTFDVAPGSPAGVRAGLTGDREITLSWNQGADKDLKKYYIYNASTGDVLTSVPNTNDFCSAGTCSDAIGYPPSKYGQQTFQVTALRPDGAGDYVESDKSSTAAATLPAPPTPDPTPPPGGGGGGGGTGGGGGSNGGGGGTGGGGGSNGGGGAGGGGSGAGGGNGGSGSSGLSALGGVKPGLTFTASAGNVILPPAPPPAIAAPGELDPSIGSAPDGPYSTTLPYGKHATTADGSVHRNAASRVFHDVSVAFNGPRLARSLAIAFLLLLAGAHLRVWLHRPVL
ncbi:MAG: hypothetical protein ACJ735_14020 [Actinomycetes bacterium]